MDNKNILIISRGIFPSSFPRANRATELAKEMSRRGNQVTLITLNNPDYDYKDFESMYGIKVINNIILKHQKPNLFKTKRNVFVRLKDRFLYQYFLYPEIELAFALRRELINQSITYDLLISIAKPYAIHIGVAMAYPKIKKKIPCWVADCGDPFTGGSSLIRQYPYYMRWVEQWMFNHTDFVSLPVETATTAYPKTIQHKIKIIPQGFNFKNVNLSQINKECFPVFGYAGALYRKTRDPKHIMDHLVSLNNEFKFIVYTDTRDLLSSYQQRLGHKLEIRDPVPREQLLYELSEMDFLINIENTTKQMVPSKIIDYHLTKRPILSLHPDNFEKSLIDDFLSGNYQNQYTDDFTKYEISNVAEAFLRLTDHG